MSEIDELRSRMARQAACFAESNGYTPRQSPW